MKITIKDYAFLVKETSEAAIQAKTLYDLTISYPKGYGYINSVWKLSYAISDNLQWSNYDKEEVIKDIGEHFTLFQELTDKYFWKTMPIDILLYPEKWYYWFVRELHRFLLLKILDELNYNDSNFWMWDSVKITDFMQKVSFAKIQEWIT